MAGAILMAGNAINMNTGGGTGSGTLNMDGGYIYGSSGEFMGRLFLKPAAVSLRSVQVGAWVA